MNTVTVTFDDPIYHLDQDYTYIKGVPFTGLLKIVDDVGNLVLETQYKDGMINGYDKEYYPGGVKIKYDSSEYIVMAGKIRYLKEWDEQGNLVYHENVRYGENFGYTREIVVDNRPYMILALDVHYKPKYAKCVGVLFNWDDDTYRQKIEVSLDTYAEYEPGQFYKRELPCLLKAIEQCSLKDIKAIIVDGHVYTDEDTMGLGGHLYNALENKIPVIGVAKNGFSKNKKVVEKLLRGNSKKPLYISAIGFDVEEAVRLVKEMKGAYRMPTILAEMDGLTKED